ncbi:LysM peptidoglycan-binding domain-containing protein [Paenibacillus wynnii]|uniref:LysM peptidoglycan-binding domain-containing protein n=1 Tax=Paenibacillus wynnii TaxID=268407 RepID=UPI00068BE455|nr:LysM peptidoglycan-binding domain-containing protein [Paenibacillus wynnii]
MFDQSHGLRFDIYERIHLSEELPGIAELEEVELLPEIQVIQREDRAELYGQLLLTGLYRSEEDRIERLEHAIPVEITVPLTRVSSLEDIGVEIENFDIDLLTMRSVNITGVLSLRGIGGTEAVPVWQQEEYTVAYTPEDGERVAAEPIDTHEREGDALYENSLWTFGEGTFDEPVEDHNPSVEAVDLQVTTTPVIPEQSRENELIVHTHSLNEDPSGIQPNIRDYWKKTEAWNLGASFNERKDSTVADEVEVATIDVYEADNISMEENVHHEAPSQVEDASDFTPIAENDFIEAAESIPVPVPVPEEKADLKIALGSKKEPKAEDKEPITFSTLLNSSRDRKIQENLHVEEVTTAAAVASPDSGNDKEWKNRFIGGQESANLFRKVRLCIVQREETLDTIADKYQLSARELIMYNRLSGQNVEEGQVLYIP